MIRNARESDYSQIQDIFWKTSAKTQFGSEEEKNQFEYKYLEYFFKYEKSLFFVYEDKKEILGYICCVFNILEHKELFDLLSYHNDFQDYFMTYQSECHINLHPNSQGMGIGSALLDFLKSELHQRGSKGFFVFTASTALNREFYQKNGLNDVMSQNHILMMGIKNQ